MLSDAQKPESPLKTAHEAMHQLCAPGGSKQLICDALHCHIIELAADRTPYICQSQSLNLFLPADIDKWDLHMLHWTAWERGIKSLYYCRSKSISRAGFAGQLEKKDGAKVVAIKTDYEECLACQ